jgi:hypothetical protein
VGIILSSGCDQKPETAGQYGKALLDSKTRAEDAAVKANLDALQKAIQAYRAANDKFPQSLQDVAPLIGSAMDLSKYDYDPQTGEVRLK